METLLAREVLKSVLADFIGSTVVQQAGQEWPVLFTLLIVTTL